MNDDDDDEPYTNQCTLNNINGNKTNNCNQKVHNPQQHRISFKSDNLCNIPQQQLLIHQELSIKEELLKIKLKKIQNFKQIVKLQQQNKRISSHAYNGTSINTSALNTNATTITSHKPCISSRNASEISVLISFLSKNQKNQSFVCFVDHKNNNIFKFDQEIIINKEKNIQVCMADNEWVYLLLYMDECYLSENILSSNINNNSSSSSSTLLQTNTNHTKNDEIQQAKNTSIPSLSTTNISASYTITEYTPKERINKNIAINPIQQPLSSPPPLIPINSNTTTSNEIISNDNNLTLNHQQCLFIQQQRRNRNKYEDHIKKNKKYMIIIIIDVLLFSL